QTKHGPRLGLGNRAAFRDFDQVADLVLVLFVVSVIFVRTHDDLAVKRVLDTTLDQHGHRFVHLVADHTTGQRTLQLGFAHFYFPAFSRSTVRTRAMSRRTLPSWLVLESCWVASCMRRLN